MELKESESEGNDTVNGYHKGKEKKVQREKK